MLPHELLVKIFYNLEQRPQHRHSSTTSISFSSSLSLDRTDILACALVCQDWYYAAVDTLWRDVDLQSVESFIQFGMVLDPTFSYMDSSPRLCVYRQQQQHELDCRNSAGGYIDEEEDGIDECMDQERRRRQLLLPTNGYSEGNNNSSGAINIFRCCSLTAATTATTQASITGAGAGTGTGTGTGTTTTFSASSSLLSSSTLSTASASSSSPSSASSCYTLSSLRCPSIPDQIGCAGKGYIRTFSLAGTTDCQAPRPFPHLPSCITDRHLNAISSSLTHLTSISLSHCTALTDITVIQLITSSSPYLKSIDLTECRLLTNLTVQVIARLCSQLEELSLQGCGLVTDDAIEEVALHCTRLHSINIGQCQRAGDKSLEALLRASGQMTQLDPSSRVRTRNAQLTKLSVAGCRGITYSGLSAITERLNVAGSTEQEGYLQSQQRSSLVSLEFTCPAVKTPTFENVSGLSMLISTTPTSTRTQSQASRFFRTLPATLEEISIHDAYTLSHSDIITLVDQVGMGLKVLRFDHANAINSETLGHVLAVCPNLTVLSIPRASRLDDSGVVQLVGAKCASSLVELDLSACHSLTDGSLTALAKCTPTSSRTSALPENDKGKGIQEQPDPCLFPNLRRLDLSYNDKMTLGGIIPLVMSLKNLCALDVSFCGDGVTRSWSSTLESLRPILNPTSSSAMDSAGIDDLLGGVVIESDYSEDEESSNYSQQQQYTTRREQQLQFSPHVVSSTAVTPPQQYGLSSQNLQQFMNGVAPLVNPSRLSLGRYVGPLLTRATSSNTITNTNNGIVLQHPQQYPGQGGTSLNRSSLGNRRRSSGSSVTSSSSTSSIMSSSSSGSSSSSMISDCPSTSSSSSSSSSSSFSQGKSPSGSAGPKRNTHSRRRSCSRILLADRLDVLENTPRRVGVAASFHLESWFTPQHQLQLQHLFQIQSQHQRDLQEIQAAAVQAALGNQMLNQHNAHANNATGAAVASSLANSMPFAALSAEMMNHPVMTAIRIGAATVGGINNGGGPPANEHDNGGVGGSVDGGVAHGAMHGAGVNNTISQNLFDSTNNNNETPPQVYHRNRRLSVTAGDGAPGPGAGAGVTGGSRAGGVRHHYRHHYQHPQYQPHHLRSPLSSAAMGHCEISAWGLIKLREEWAAVI
ncbi:hypothetical protein BGZ47_006379 [Haplosporangium gracile]|nr:hypothetical protein BGZ47_006379 [Haplosporangium gracile]